MIKFVTGDLFESGADCLINTVNCEGFMGKGIAYQFKMRFPQNNKDYVKACKEGTLRIGTIHFYKESGVWIVNFPTKNKWREKSKTEYVEKGLDQLVKFVLENDPKIIAIPPLGCGNGGLDWNTVKNMIVEKLQIIEKEHTFLIYEPIMSSKTMLRRPPNMSVLNLALLQIRMQLIKTNILRLQNAGYFTNYFLGDDFFIFDTWESGPHSHAIDIEAKALGEYQKCYGLNNSKDTYEQILKMICSKKTEGKLEKLLPAIEQATAYVNGITSDKKLEGVTTVLYIVWKNHQIQEADILRLFRNRSKEIAKRFTKQYVMDCIGYLEQTGVISKDICGNYEMPSNMWR